MLVLSRRPDEQIVIQLGTQRVVVHVIGVGCGRVSLGITAPPQVKILRAELERREEFDK